MLVYIYIYILVCIYRGYIGDLGFRFVIQGLGCRAFSAPEERPDKCTLLHGNAAAAAAQCAR